MSPLSLWILIFLFSGPLFAGPHDPDLAHSHDQFFVKIMDDPAGIAQWSRDLLENPSSQLSAFDRAKLVGIYGGTCYERRCIDDPWFSEKVVREAIAVAEKGSDKSLIMRLYLMLDYITSSDLDLTESLKNLDQLKLKAESMGGGRILADVYREYSGVFESFDDKPKALLYLQKALEEVKKDSFPGDLLPYMLQYDAGVLSAHMGDLDKARRFYQEPLDFCRREKIRHYGALIMANLGRSFIKQEKPDIQQGLAYLEEAEALILGMEETMVRSYIAIVRGEGQFLKNDFESAATQFKKAYDLFTQAQSEQWKGESAYWVAKAQAQRKDYKGALEWLRTSEKFLRPDATSEFMRMEALRSSIQKGMGNFPAALAALEKSLEMRNQIDKDTQQGEISRLRSQLEFTVQENQNERLKRENVLKSQQLRQALAVGFVILLLFALSVRQTRKLRSAQNTIHNILQSIEEGILTIGRGFRVEASLSPYIDQLIEREPYASSHTDVFHTLMKKVDLTHHEKQLIHDTLEACMGATFLTWELNHAHLPIEVTINQGQKILALDWRPIMGRGQHIDHILLVLRDHSSRRQLEKQLSVERDRLSHTTQQIQEIIRARPQRVRHFLDRFLSEEAKVQNLRRKGPSSELALVLHTLKGDARTLGLQSLVAQTHALESNTADDKLWDHWYQHLLQYRSLLDNFEESSDSKRVPSQSSLHELAVEICDGLKEHMHQHGLILQRFCIDDGWGETAVWNAEGLRLILLHGLTNAVDHGFVIPQNQGFSRRHMELAVQARLSPTALLLIISDNGAGIDRVALAQKYGKDPDLSDEDVENLILQPGVSAAPSVSETSGRGIGLHAIQSQLQSWNGSIRIRSQKDAGTRLELEWPRI